VTTSHFGTMLLFAFFVSTIFSVIAKDTPREQLQMGARLFGGFVAAGVVLGWIMLALPL
jgi:hypothetical protein